MAREVDYPPGELVFPYAYGKLPLGLRPRMAYLVGHEEG